jgi:hypothetical protein
MAIEVPRLDRPRVQEQAAPAFRQSVNAGVDAFGGGAALNGVTQAAQGLASAGQQMYLEEKAKADDVATQEAYVALKKMKQAKLWDPKEGALARQGKDSFGALDEYGTSFDTEADKIEEGLSNDTQKALFRKMRQSEKLEFDGSLQKHIFQETQKFDDQTTAATIQVERDEALLNYTDPAKIQKSLTMVRAAALSNADRMGLSPELTQLKVQGEISKTHSAIVDRYLANGQDLEAKAYFDANKADITGQDAAAMEKALEAGNTLGESQRKATEIMQTNGGSLSAALEQARQIENPNVQEATVREIKTRFGEQELVKKDADETRFRNAANVIEQTKQRPPANVWANLSLQERNALDSRLSQLRQGVQPETDWTLYSDLKLMASNPSTRQQFLDKDPTIYRAKLADAEYKEIVNIFSGLRNGDGKTTKLLDGYRTNSEIVNTALLEIGVDPSPDAGSSDAETVATFRKKVDEQIIRQQSETGKEVSTTDVQKIVDDLRVESITSKGWLWNTKQRVFELEAGQQIEVDPDDIPAPDKKKIEEALRRRGIAPTPDKILNLYTQKLQGLVPGGN